MPSSGVWRRVDVVDWTDVSEDRIASIVRVEKSAIEEPAWEGSLLRLAGLRWRYSTQPPHWVTNNWTNSPQYIAPARTAQKTSIPLLRVPSLPGNNVWHCCSLVTAVVLSPVCVYMSHYTWTLTLLTLTLKSDVAYTSETSTILSTFRRCRDTSA
jgi:hypothetical protein